MTNPSIEQILTAEYNNRNKIKDFDTAMNETAYWKRWLLLGDIDPDVGEAIESMIRFYNAFDEERDIPVEERQPIYLFIDSNGGDLDASLTIVDAITLSTTPVYTVNIGTAYSGGFFCYIAGHKRMAYPHSSFLYHEGSTSVGGDAGKFQNFSSFYKAQLNLIRDLVLEKTNITPELYEEKRRDDWWMKADEALELGAVDEIITKFIY